MDRIWWHQAKLWQNLISTGKNLFIQKLQHLSQFFSKKWEDETNLFNLYSARSKTWAKGGGWEFVLLALPAFLPFKMVFFTQNSGGGVWGGGLPWIRHCCISVQNTGHTKQLQNDNYNVQLQTSCAHCPIGNKTAPADSQSVIGSFD